MPGMTPFRAQDMVSEKLDSDKSTVNDFCKRVAGARTFIDTNGAKVRGGSKPSGNGHNRSLLNQTDKWNVGYKSR